jgi:arginase family enzyme
MSQVTPKAMVAFIDHDGCRQAAESLRQVVSSQILPNIPCLIGVDHSLTGGMYNAMADRLGANNLSLVIIDSHTDAVPMDVLAGAIAYDMESNSNSVYDPEDPLLYNRSDSYNASSFVHHLLAENRVDPKNLYLIGVGDIPDKKVARIKDVRMIQYVETFTRLKRRGVGVLTKKDLTMRPSKLNHLMGRIKTPYMYISIDMDIGADNALEGVRFHNRRGISEKQMYRLADALRKRIDDGIELAGLDLCEFNPRRAGGADRTYRIAANLIANIAFGRNRIQTAG